MLIVDAGPLYAAAAQRDTHHERAVNRRHFSVVRPRHVEAFVLVP